MSSTFAIGDKVQWTHVQTRLSGMINFSAKEGTLVETNGGYAIVKMRNGRKASVPLGKLEAAGQPNELTRMLGPSKGAA